MAKLLSLAILVPFISGTSSIPVDDQCTHFLPNLGLSIVINAVFEGGGISYPGQYLSLDLEHSLFTSSNCRYKMGRRVTSCPSKRLARGVSGASARFNDVDQLN